MTWEEQLQRAFETATSRLKDDIAREVQAVARDLVTQLRREREDSATSGPSSSAQAGLPVATRLLEAARALDQAGSLSEVLDRLITSAALEASRVGLVLAVGEELRGWRFIGFPADDQPSSVAMPRADAGVLSAAVRTGASTAVDPASPKLAPPTFAAPGGASGVAVPVTIGGEVVAVLYADQEGEDGSRGSTSAWPDAIELLARHAARCLEAKTALNAVHVLAERPQPPAPRSEPARSIQAAPTPVRAAESPSDADESALRYARLLVSEIKLYNETAVAAGQRDGDLTAHVGGEIARARLLYEERIPPKIRARRDYFRDELVRTLANGDARLLAASPVLGLRS